MIVLLRLMIAVILFYAGLVFLSVTTSLTDLILNSTALSFLIEVDTLIHMAFLGGHLKALPRLESPISIFGGEAISQPTNRSSRKPSILPRGCRCSV